MLAMWRPLLVLCATAVAACGGDGDDQTVTVFAAASLTEAFADIAAAFEADHPDVDIALNFAGSTELVAQIAEGAPADVVATADEVTMGRLDVEPVTFATNRLQIVVEPGNPIGIAGLADLADPSVVVVRCADAVPCGAYAIEVLDRAGVELEPASLEANVKAVVTKVAAGEADAGLAYATDVAAADVDGIEVAEAADVEARYPIAILDRDDAAAADFLAAVLGDTGQSILADHGFGAP
jgi:molybdate transport system substrate-binding protein